MKGVLCNGPYDGLEFEPKEFTFGPLGPIYSGLIEVNGATYFRPDEKEYDSKGRLAYFYALPYNEDAPE